ncbi:type I-B CRISPR-associated protein Cas5b [Methanosphaera sp. WGK6]|uniref:type I-B CRISPR-associated protein Cas5b n=1 Tax=Methanosphaera sp. WGK6 TaxID=1561964 RepID=UPI00084CD9AB|nr:type I-B CRISPR-associated protein Cas5b [Methanosphaera sp. WGK6]OED29880.1 hypothetical protein NL43_05550 [Methanosphaera sp. WGK6]
MNLVVFDVWGDYAYFRRGYTTTSTISYPFPSRTTIAGFISGILGKERDSYYDLFQKNNSKIGLKIINPIEKTRINLNYVNTKESIVLFEIKGNGKRTQVPAEFLKNVKYRIYLSLDDDDILNEFYGLLKEHKSVYTPYLGISECLANFSLVSEDIFSVEPIKEENVHIDSVVLKNSGKLVIESGKRYGVIKSPGYMDENRVVSDFLEYYYESNGKSILLDSCEYYKVGEDNVILY